MMERTELRWGVLGTARIADEVVRGIRRSSNGVVAAVASRSEEAARIWADERGVPTHFGSYDDLLASDAVDAVYIPLPNALHAEWAVRAAEQGKHVLCEKPVALSAEQTAGIAEAARRNGVRIMEAFMYRFHPQTERIRQLVQEGKVGKPVILRATFDFLLKRPHDVRWSKELGGGALMDVGCYCVNVCNLLMSGSPAAVTASAVWAESGVDESLVGTLEYADGVLAVIDCSFRVGRSMQQGLRISGTEGVITTDYPFRISDDPTSITVDRAEHGAEPEIVEVEGANEYHRMAEHFAACVLGGREPAYSLTESLANMRTIEALAEAARTGRRVEVGA